MRKTFFLIIICLNFSINGFCQDFQWARQIKGITYDYNDLANSTDVDANGNSYTVGRTESPLFDIDPTVSGVEIIDNFNIQNFAGTYLVKVDSNGNYLWGKTFGTIKRGDNAYDVKIGKDGNIYVLLTLEELSISNPNIINSFITIIKIDPNGNVLSTKKIQQNYGYNNVIYISSFDLDNQNNIFISGKFLGNIAIDSNNPSLNLSSNGIGSYLIKINNNGNFDWVKQFSDDAISKVIVRPDGNVNLFLMKSGNSTLTNIDNLNNSIIWQKTFINQGFRSFHIFEKGIVILGVKNYYDTVDVDPSSSVLNISGNSTNSIIFLNLNGDFIDVKQFFDPPNGMIIFTAVTTDSNGNYFFAGGFKDTIDLDPSNNIFDLTSEKGVFYLKLDANRDFDTAIKIESSYSIYVKGIKVVNENNYIIGDFQGWCDFDPSTTTQYPLETINSSTINSDGFILKLGPCDNSKVVGDNNQYFCSASNPTISSISPNSSSIKWYDSLNSTTPLSKTSLLLDNKKYYATRKNGNCPESTDRLEVTVHITSSPQAPLSLSPKFCLSDNAKLVDVTILGQNIKWYANVTDVTIIPITTLLQNGITYYASQTINGCESERTPIIVIVNNLGTPTTTSPQTFCIQQNATLSSIAITGQNIKWYDVLTNGNLLANTTLLQNGITYYASQTVNGCESERIPVLINIQNTLAPTGDSNQSFCTSQNPTIANIIVTGNIIKWYDSLSNGSLLTQTTNLVNGKTYYASQTTTNCESERFGVSISIVNTPSAPTANTNQSFCKKENASLNTIQISGQNIKWYDTNLTVATLPNTTLLENNKTYYASQTIGCESDRTAIIIQVYDTPLPTHNTNQQFCIDENATLSNFNIAGSNIKWYDESTNVNILAETTLLQNGKTYYATQTLNDCESERLAITVKIQDTQRPIANSPQTFCIQKNAKISDIAISGQNVNWFESAYSSIHLSESTLLENGITYYALQTINNCKSDRIPVSIIILDATSADCINFVDELPYPKFFTPNNDGYNDNWTIDFAYLAPNTEIKIFDRYGKLIKILVSNTNKWNGTFNGAELPATDYWFVVTRANGVEYNGHFSLKR
ncbi:Ig-like domain-containing protein [Flavobacterium soyangense]|uniref:T9SS type B sorting domain-containing protein n=1 Tax=Flavobacterium soyangense TaxID=2023265 RepID=A0A930U9W2_9FLAO|nr:T9SS type B sorting domain-containing protein [Flavobacterium soyangense]MBF2707544.1 T9SS type B sorting domain-containing protein [Flavobacterium soyangense]